MKRLGRMLALFCLTALFLAGTAAADAGPKPQLIVRIVNGPEELYYLDILAQGEYQGHTYDGVQWSYSDEEAAALDQTLLEALRAAVPEGWHACTAEGSTGAPMWGDLKGEKGIHTFGYVGVPDTYRILIVTKSGESWISPVLERKALQSSVTVDWAAKTAKAPPAWAGYVLQFLATLVPTLLIEGILLLAFGFDWKKNWRAFLLVNLVTQGALAVFLSYNFITTGVHWVLMLFLFPLAEVAITIVETALYVKLLDGGSRAKKAAYGLTANAASAIIGWFLAGPVWQWIVSIS